MDAIETSLRGYDTKPARREGDRQMRWVLLDFLELVVHVQHVDERSYYALERLWRDCPQLTLDTDVDQSLAESPASDPTDAAEADHRTDGQQR